MPQIKEFFQYAIMRENIRIKKEVLKKPKPWTTDEVLQTNRFCNVFREDDRTTIWFRENIRDVLKNDPRVFFATVVFRWFNRIETGDRIKHLLFEPPSTYRQFKDEILTCLKGVKPIVTGSYIVRAPNGMSKLEGIVQCIEPIYRMEVEAQETLQQLHKALMKFPFIGSFVAYEIVTDLRHTYICNTATDVNTWAAAGPGAARGLARVYDFKLEKYSHHNWMHQVEMNELMRNLLVESRKTENWPATWKQWEMREVEHTLCEFDKYVRCKDGTGKTKQVYNGRG